MQVPQQVFSREKYRGGESGRLSCWQLSPDQLVCYLPCLSLPLSLRIYQHALSPITEKCRQPATCATLTAFRRNSESESTKREEWNIKAAHAKQLKRQQQQQKKSLWNRKKKNSCLQVQFGYVQGIKRPMPSPCCGRKQADPDRNPASLCPAQQTLPPSPTGSYYSSTATEGRQCKLPQAWVARCSVMSCLT